MFSKSLRIAFCIADPGGKSLLHLCPAKMIIQLLGGCIGIKNHCAVKADQSHTGIFRPGKFLHPLHLSVKPRLILIVQEAVNHLYGICHILRCHIQDHVAADQIKDDTVDEQRRQKNKYKFLQYGPSHFISSYVSGRTRR